MSKTKISDLLGVLKGVQSIRNALIKHQEDTIKYKIIHSSLKNLPEKCLQAAEKKLNNTEPSKVPVSFAIPKLICFLMYVASYKDCFPTGTDDERFERSN